MASCYIGNPWTATATAIQLSNLNSRALGTTIPFPKISSKGVSLDSWMYPYQCTNMGDPYIGPT